MGLNRMMMRKKGTQNIEAFLTIGYTDSVVARAYGYNGSGWEMGSLYPNPLPNGIKIESLYIRKYNKEFRVYPPKVTVTINGVHVRDGEESTVLFNYMAANVSKTVPVIFHFD